MLPARLARLRQHEASEDHAIDLLGPPRVSAQPDRRQSPDARHRHRDVAERVQQAARVSAFAPVSSWSPSKGAANTDAPG